MVIELIGDGLVTWLNRDEKVKEYIKLKKKI